MREQGEFDSFSLSLFIDTDKMFELSIRIAVRHDAVTSTRYRNKRAKKGAKETEQPVSQTDCVSHCDTKVQRVFVLKKDYGNLETSLQGVHFDTNSIEVFFHSFFMCCRMFISNSRWLQAGEGAEFEENLIAFD